MSRLFAFLCRLLLLAAVLGFGYAAVLVAMQYQPIGWLILVALVWRMRPAKFRPSTAHGSARLLSRAELQRAGLLGSSGLILGRAGYSDPPSRFQALCCLFSLRVRSAAACLMLFAAFRGRWTASDRMIRLKEFTHIITCAPTGRGKGRCVIVPNLLSYHSSVIVTDPKGELVGLTAGHRQREMGHSIVKLDPFALTGSGAATLNPLDFVDENAPDFLDACRDLANALVVRKGTETDPHWNDSAELVLTAFIAYVCACEKNPAYRNLTLVRKLISSRHRYFDELVKMQKVEGFGGVVATLGHQLTWFVDEELGSVLSTANRHTSFLDSPAVAACIQSSSFDPGKLRSGKMTLYLCLPPERLVTLAPLMRLWVSTLLRVLIRGKASEKHQVLFLLDEAGHLGHIQMLENAVTLMRGYGIRLWFFFQSIGQLKQSFGDHASTILDNIETQQYFGINAYESAEAISKRMGDTTTLTHSLNETVQRSRPTGPMKEPQPGSYSTSSSQTTNEMGRPLFRPDELIRLPEDSSLVFHRNLRPIAVQLLRYDEAPEFKQGGTGVQRGLRLGDGVLAVIMLLVSLLAVVVAQHLPPPPQFQAPANAPGAYGTNPYMPPIPWGQRMHRPDGRSYQPSFPGWSGEFDPFYE